MAKVPWLFHRKTLRMQASPFAFLRGSAPMFYELLQAQPYLAGGPAGQGWIAGDLHLENFGCYRTNLPGHHSPSAVEFNANDFDDASIAPWRWDVVRLLTSLLLATRGAGLGGPTSLALCWELLDFYAESLWDKAGLQTPPKTIARLISDARRRDRASLLKTRTQGRGSGRRFARGERYRDIPPSLYRNVCAAFSRYALKIEPELRPEPKSLEVQDVAFRVAGTGSLGGLRFGILVHGKGGPHGAWMFDMKEEDSPACSALVQPPRLSAAERVVTALETCLFRPPKLLGTCALRGKSMLVRRLGPQEEKLALGDLPKEEWSPLVLYLAGLVAGVHRRGARSIPKSWRRADRKGLIERAVTLAGIHEAVYLAYCDLTTPLRG